MSPPEIPAADSVRLRHMLDAAREALRFSVGRDRSSLDSDAMYRRAVVSCIQEIGEAAVRVSPAARALAPGIPWRQITDMRNRLVHAYFSINADLVWVVIDRDLPPLVQLLEQTLDND
jgi:uncharacterized protein with HEPN domain